MNIYVKSNFTIIGKIDVSEEPETSSLNLKDDISESITLTITSESVEATGIYIVSEEYYKYLIQEYRPKKTPQNIEEESSSICRSLNAACKKVLRAIKFCLKNYELDDRLFSIKSVEWSKNGNDWDYLPRGGFRIVFSSRNTIPLDDESSKKIERYVSFKNEPFIALEYLHRAKNENSPKYMWIDATIAAELAIKEFLISYKPEIEILLLEVPSPPLHKLYGSILESYVGERSPKVKELAEGARIRNLLVHKPKQTHIDHQDAIDYVNSVEFAVGHLLYLLEPKLVKEGWFAGYYREE